MLGALAALALSAAPAFAATLVTPNPANNGNDGLMFNVKVGENAVTFESLSVLVWGKSARNVNFEIYTAAGGIPGATTSLNGWTLLNTVMVGVPTGEAFKTFDITDFVAEAGSTVGFYIRTLNRDYSSVMFYDVPGEVVGAESGSDDNISILSGYGVGKWGLNVGKTLVGSITYSPMMSAVPEAGTWAMMIVGFGAAGVLLRRRSQAALAD